jgi:hypothetical protein
MSLELRELQQGRGALADGRAGQAEVPPVDGEVLGHGQLPVQRVVLRNDADPGPYPRALAAWIHAQNAEGALGQSSARNLLLSKISGRLHEISIILHRMPGRVIRKFRHLVHLLRANVGNM